MVAKLVTVVARPRGSRRALDVKRPLRRSRLPIDEVRRSGFAVANILVEAIHKLEVRLGRLARRGELVLL